MDIRRICRHMLTTEWRVARAFPRDALTAIERAIKTGEARHDGEIRFAVEGALHPSALFRGQSARERAIEVFSNLHVWDTARNNGVLIYLLLADRDVEIVADRGVHAKVGAEDWERTCRSMEAALAQGKYQEAVVSGIEAVTGHLARHFPADRNAVNELADKPVIL